MRVDLEAGRNWNLPLLLTVGECDLPQENNLDFTSLTRDEERGKDIWVILTSVVPMLAEHRQH
jgi:hypothetical protein